MYIGPPKEKKNCMYYEEDNDMGAIIPYCRYSRYDDICHCEGCKNFRERSNYPIKYEDDDPRAYK